MGKLTLVPTPIADEVQLCSEAKAALLKAYQNKSLIVVEEHKVARRRWLHYGLPREAIDEFILFNEHNAKEDALKLITEMQRGRDVFLFSDCGLPAFCDPGQNLVNLCHQNNITVTSTPFANSIALAVALSGFDHTRFMFEGFIPTKTPERKQTLQSALKNKYTTVLMDTPYRLAKLLSELAEMAPDRDIFIASDLNKATEKLYRGSVKKIKELLAEQKVEFVMLIKGLV